MKALVVYDSQYGNTEAIAKAIAEGLGEEAKMSKIDEVKAEDLAPYQLIVFGSPTQGGHQTPAMKAFVDNLSADAIQGKRFAVFDTRLKNVMVKMFGYAAPRIESTLMKKGANVTAKSQGYFVKTAKGPLLDGEEEKASAWAKATAAGSPTGHLPSRIPLDPETDEQADKIQ